MKLATWVTWQGWDKVVSFLSLYLVPLLSDGSFPLPHTPHSVTAAWWLRLCRDATAEWYAEWVTRWSDTVCLGEIFNSHANTQTLHKHKFVNTPYNPFSTHTHIKYLVKQQQICSCRQSDVIIMAANTCFWACLHTSVQHKHADFNGLLFTLL